MTYRGGSILAALTVGAVIVSAVGVGWAQDADGHYRGFGEPQVQTFWNIVPPGQDGVLNAAEAAQGAAGGGTPAHFDDQLPMYAGLIADGTTPGFTADDLPTVFKDASFGVAPDDIDRVYAPGGRDDVTVVRDASFGVPHIFGETREGTMFAQGYTGAEDRLFLMDALRHVGRAQLAAWLGASDGNLAQDADQMAAAPYVEADFSAQIEDIRNSGPVGEQAYADLVAYTAGVNQYIQEAEADPTKLPAAYPALQVVPEPWVLEDAVAIASLVGGIFGKSGGGEVHNLCALRELEDAYPGRGRTILDELSFYDDAEAPTTASTTFRYPDSGPVDPASIPDLDCGSLAPIAPPDLSPESAALLPGAVEELVPTPVLPDGPEDLPFPSQGQQAPATVGDLFAPGGAQTKPFVFPSALSNALVLSGDVTDTGAPIAVFGPQTGYYVPQLLVEKDVHGPGIDARGVAFAGTDLWVQLGRGVDYAWSATSSHVDNVDQVILRLCDPEGGEATVDSMGYAYQGECREIEAHDRLYIAKPSAGGDPTGLSGADPSDPAAVADLIADLGPDDVLVRKYFERAPDYGPVRQRGTLQDGTPVAVATYRTTYGSELGSAAGFLLVNDPGVVTDVRAWREAFPDNVDYVFNWFYADDQHIAYDVSCKCHLRAAGTDPYLPYWGDGNWDPPGFLARDELPEETDPDDGYLISWNNKEAPGFRSSDSSRAFGPVHRSLLIEHRAQQAIAAGPVDVGAAVDVLALASTTDLRSQEVLPLLERVMGATAPDGLDPRTQAMWDALRDWGADDLGHRHDADGDGAYEHALAVAVMDAWWGDVPGHPGSRLSDAVFAEGHPLDPRATVGVKIMDGNLRGHVGSAFQDDVSSHLNKDLRQVLGDDVTDPWTTAWCGNGDLATCADRLWSSLSATAPALEEEFGSADPADWARTIGDDAIAHNAVGVVGVADIPWQNRPTFQQVVHFTASAAPTPPPAPPAPPPAPPLPSTGGGALGVLAGALLLGGAWRVRRRSWVG